MPRVLWLHGIACCYSKTFSCMLRLAESQRSHGVSDAEVLLAGGMIPGPYHRMTRRQAYYRQW
ncbi:hypothetical protein PISMIDRAFT_684243, partial [Pisolithus microcarpus 441]